MIMTTMTTTMVTTTTTMNIMLMNMKMKILKSSRWNNKKKPTLKSRQLKNKNKHDCKACKEELNADNEEELHNNNEDAGITIGMDAKIAGVAQITGVEPEIDEDSKDEEDQVEAEINCKYGP